MENFPERDAARRSTAADDELTFRWLIEIFLTGIGAMQCLQSYNAIFTDEISFNNNNNIFFYLGLNFT